MATAETIRSPRVTALVDHGGEGSRPPAHVGARDGGAGWRRDDGLARGHAARGRDRRQASGEVLAADVESLGGESTRTAMMVEHVGHLRQGHDREPTDLTCIPVKATAS
jgi:hypothetical protein